MSFYTALKAQAMGLSLMAYEGKLVSLRALPLWCCHSAAGQVATAEARVPRASECFRREAAAGLLHGLLMLPALLLLNNPL